MQIAKQFGELYNYSIYQLNNKMGLAGAPNGEQEQRILTQPIYDVIYPFVNGFAIVKKGSFYGVIDKFGNVTIPVEMPYIQHHWKEGYFYLSSNRLDGWHYKVDDYYRKVLVQSESEEAMSIIESTFARKPKWASFAISKQIIFVTFESERFIFNTTLKKIIFRGNGKSKVINGDKIIVEEESTGKHGIINTKGDVLVPFAYDDLFYCATNETYAENNLIEAKLNGKSGYIDFSGRVRIPFDYLSCGTFVEGTAWVSNRDGKAGLIDYDGRILEPLIHDNGLCVVGAACVAAAATVCTSQAVGNFLNAGVFLDRHKLGRCHQDDGTDCAHEGTQNNSRYNTHFPRDLRAVARSGHRGRQGEGQDEVRHYAFRQRAGFERLGDPALPRADSQGRSGYGYAPRHHALLHDDSGGLSSGNGGCHDVYGHPDLCLRHG